MGFFIRYSTGLMCFLVGLVLISPDMILGRPFLCGVGVGLVYSSLYFLALAVKND